MIELAQTLNKDLFLLLVDYEKAFDFANRAIILQDLMSQGIGGKFIRAIASMFSESHYIPKTEGCMVGDLIRTFYGVAQGRKSSTNLFSFLIREMPRSITENPTDFMDPFNVAQMADDTILAAESLKSLASKFDNIKTFSNDKNQTINTDKTVYIHMSETPQTNLLACKDGTVVSSLEQGKSSPYLGMYLYHTNSLKRLIEYNIKKRKFNVAKFKSWLEVNKNTPLSIKMLVLDNCVLSSILYGSEAWGDLTFISNELVTIELDLLKSVLGVKSGTPTKLVYHELRRGSIASKLIDRQVNFIKKIKELNVSEALVKCMWDRCQNTDICHYYNSITSGNFEKDKQSRINEINNSTKTMDVRYRTLVGLHETHCIYDSDVSDSCRTVLTRWRLSNFDFAIEKGRHGRYKLDIEDRLCKTCLTLEDEEHVLFACPMYHEVRANHQNVFNNKSYVKKILNPQCRAELYETANILKKFEKIHAKFTK